MTGNFGGLILISKEKLQSETAKKLTQMATAKGIKGAASMRKDELIKKLVSLAKSKLSAKPTAKQPSRSVVKPATKKPAAKPVAIAAKPAPAKTGQRNAKTTTKSVAAKVAIKKTAIAVVATKPPSSAKPLATASAKPTEKPIASSVKPGKPTRGAPSGGAEAIVTATAKKISQPRTTPTRETSPSGSRAPAKLETKSRPTNPVVAGKIKSVQQQRASAKDLAFFREQLSTSEEPKKDRLVLFVRDPYWLQAYWEVTSTGVDRAKAALAEDWHVAVPVLRLLVNPEDGVTGSSEQVAREIKIHGGVNNWYIEVSDPPHTFRAAIGYLAPGNRFHSIAYSNVVHTPTPGTSDHIDHNWTDLIDNGDRVFSLSGGFEEGASIALREVFEEKLSRPMTRSALSRYGTSEIPGKPSGDDFVVDAELLIFGKTHRSSEVTISGEPVKLRDDGSFTVRVGLPDKRQVFPVSSTSFDGTFTYTTVLAIERNTKVMEPMSTEPGEDF